MARFCSNCGAQLKETSKFCRECGTKTDLPATPVPPSVPSPATPPASVPPAPQVTHPTSQPARNLASLSSNQPAMSATAPVAPAASQPASRHASNTAPRSAGQQSAPRHNSQAEPAKPAKASGCWRGCAVTVLIMLLIAGIGALCIVKGCQPEEPPQPDKPNNPNKPYTNSWPPLPNQKKSPKANSAAITREIQKGVILSVPKGALGRSKKLDVKPVTELNETLQTANRQLLERNIFAVAAWEVDAGLADDERLPGYYTLSVDLGELGIDKSLHSQVRFYRVTDKGDIFEYCTALDGQTASFQSNQNSFVLAAVGIVVIGLPAVFTGAAYVVEYRRETSYYCKTDGENWYIECPTNAKPFQLYWNGKDVDKDFYDNLEKLKKRQNTIINAAKKKYPKTWLEHATSAVSDASSLFSANLGLSKAAQEALDKDPEYQKLKKQIESVPPFIEQTITKIATAYAYLGQVVKVKMPSYTVCFYLKKNLGVLGYQTSTLLRNPYIEINIQQDLKDTAQSGGEKWDNLLLTITHELFHICQEEYHFSYGVNSKKFDEMVTVLLEADALEYYKRTKIITTTPELTSDGPYEYLFQYPMDKDEEGDKAGQYGYALSKFASFVRKQSGKSKITAKNLMEAREYYSRPNISTPLQKCFGISSITLGEYFVSYCQKSFGTFAKAYEGAGYLPLVKLTPAKPVPKSINFSGRFSCMMVRIVLPQEKDCAVIIVPKDNAAQTTLCVEPDKHPSQLKRGIFLPSPKSSIAGDVMMIFAPSKDESLKTGFTAYAIPAPQFKEFKANTAYIRLVVPDISLAGKQGLTAGFLLNLKPSSGPAKVIPIGPERAGKEIKIKLTKVFPKLKPGEQLQLTATICEYAMDEDDKRCLGPLSQELSASVDVPEPEPTETPEPEPTETPEPEPTPQESAAPKPSSSWPTISKWKTAHDDNNRYIYVATTFTDNGAKISRGERIKKTKARISANIKGYQKEIADIKEALKNNREDAERAKGKIAILQRMIDRDSKTLHNYDDPDWVNFAWGNPLSISWSRDGSNINGVTLLMARSGNVWNKSIYYENLNPGPGGSFTAVDSRDANDRISVQLPLGGGKGSLTRQGTVYEVIHYDKTTYDRYLK